MHLPSLLQSALLVGSLAGGVCASGFGRFGNLARGNMARGADPELLQPEYIEDEKRDTSSYHYLNAKTKPYQVTSMPEINYDLGEMYSGLVPIKKGNTKRQLFFVFAPKISGPPVNEITIWFNGGPGCSSLLGFLQENGRYRWIPGTKLPTPNPYAWNNLTNMLWIEQPVGTGYSIGKPTATSQEETAQDVVDWFLNWSEIFGVKNHKIYVTGESYAGRYVPYVSAAFLNQKNKVNYDLSGALVYDPCIGAFDYVAEEATVVPLIQANPQLFNFNASFMNQLEKLHNSCGYAAFIEKYLTFPPPGVQPPKKLNFNTIGNCDIFDLALIEALAINPCFDPYAINQQCPLLYDILGFPTILNYVSPGQKQIYFNRTDVKKALHAPLDVNWTPCSNKPVFVGGKNGHGGPQGEGDLSADPIQKVLPQVVEATNRVLVANGDFDMIIITDGTLLSIQNMTWNGKLGFQQKPSTPIDITLKDLEYHQVYVENGLGKYDGAQGIMGIQHYERGLMWGQTYQSGHMGPQFQSRVAYRHLQWLLGHINTL